MILDLPPLEFVQGKVLCLHIPRDVRADGAAVERSVAESAARSGRETAVGRPAAPLPGLRWWLWGVRSAQWLSRVGGVGPERAVAIIAGFGVPVADALGHNAGTPRRLLGIAAAICRGPAVLVYSTAGLDPSGRRDVHRYVEAAARGLCAVHVSVPSEYGDASPAPRLCPASARCIELTTDAFDGDRPS